MNLRVDRLNAFYGASHVLFDLELHVAPGETVALIGRNGAGKTTALHCVMGLLPSRSGSIRLDGRETIGMASHRIARLGLGLVPQGRRIFGELTAEENLRVGARPSAHRGVHSSPHAGAAREAPRWTLDRVFEVFPLLESVRESKGAWLSGGEQQVLSIARTLLGNPRLLLLDEPTEGLAPRIVQTLTEHLLAIKQAGLSILLAEQHLGLVSELADRAYVIDRGRVCAQGAPAELLADDELRRAYLSL